MQDSKFDTDIDASFFQAQALYYDKLKLKEGEHRFLQRPEEEEEMYAKMHQDYEEGDSEEDEDKLI